MGAAAVPDPSMPYTMFTRGEVPIGGSMQLPDEAVKMGAPPHWIAYIGTPDVDKTVAQALAMGARTYVAPTDIPNDRPVRGARRCRRVRRSRSSRRRTSSRRAPPELGDISWHELAAADAAAAFDFYSALTGWEKTGEQDMGPMGVYRMFGRQGHPLGGMFEKPADMPAPPHWLLYVRVADINAAADAVTANGGQVLNGPMEVPGGDWIVQCLDPQGAVFALHQRKAG